MKRIVKDQNGNVIFYILIAVTLLAALSYVMTRGSGENAQASVASRISEEVKSQAQTIRAAILECNLVEGNGYPLDPDTPTAMADVECDDGSGTPPLLFSGQTGRFLPQPPAPFTAGWIYSVDDPDAGDIYIELSEATNCTGGLATAMSYLDSQYSPEEAIVTCNGTEATFRLNIIDMPP